MDSFNSRLDDSLKKRANELGRLTTLLRSELPPESDGHYQVANIRDRTLVILTDSPVWTTKLRQLGPRILTILHNSGKKNILHIRVFTRPEHSPAARITESAKPKPRQISHQSTELLKQTASYIEDDGLREALKKLVRHTSVKNEPDKND